MSYIKVTLSLIVVGSYFILTAPLYLFLQIWPYGTKKILSKLVSFLSRILLIILDIKVESNHHDHNFKENTLIVGNHLSYIDIFLLSHIVPTSFVTSLEMKKTPLLGQITQLAGCLYVNRQDKSNISKEIEDIKIALEKGLHVTIFPEARSTNGEEVIRFRRPLFQAAIDAKVHVLPVTINYTHIGESPVSKENRDHLFWYDDTPFFIHFLRLSKQKKIKVKLDWEKDKLIHPEQSIEDIQLKSYQIVSSNYKPV